MEAKRTTRVRGRKRFVCYSSAVQCSIEAQRKEEEEAAK